MSLELATGPAAGGAGHLAAIFLAAALTNNIALTGFLGMCSFIALSKNTRVACGMGVAVTVVTVLTVTVNWLVNRLLLVPLQLEIFQFLVFVLTIAALVQLLELIGDRFFPALHSAFGIYLPLITVNCAILGASLFMLNHAYDLAEAVCFALGVGVGWTLAIVTLGGLRHHLVFAAPPRHLGEVGTTMVLAGLMAMAFAGFAGLVKL